MSDHPAWSGQAYLDELRPGRLELVRVALFATYSVDLSAVAATLLALIGRNNDKGSGTAVDFAQAIDTLRDRVRIIIQRGRIARPIALPRIAGILDQFIVEQRHDERLRSWHPKIALVAYDCPRGETRWKLWIGSRNLTRSQDLDAGILLEGSEKRGKGRVRLQGVGALGATLARHASREDTDTLAAELELIWWDAPDGFRLRALLDGLDEGVPLLAEPPVGKAPRPTGPRRSTFEIGGKTPGHEKDDNMTLSMSLPRPGIPEHWSVGTHWEAPWKLAADFHVYGLEWDKEDIKYYVDGVLVRR